MATLDSRLAVNASAKLNAALDHLGDWLSTHRASRFRPRQEFLLDEWLRLRKSRQDFLVDEWLRLRRDARLQGVAPARGAHHTVVEATPRFLLREAEPLSCERLLRVRGPRTQ